jgi:hypothetical protein
MHMSYNYLFDSYRNVVDNTKKGESKEALRRLTSIDDKEATNLVKIFVQSEMQLRRIKICHHLHNGSHQQ